MLGVTGRSEGAVVLQASVLAQQLHITYRLKRWSQSNPRAMFSAAMDATATIVWRLSRRVSISMLIPVLPGTASMLKGVDNN